MKVLSLFDGMACGMLAFQKADIEIERYVAYEIDKYAIKVATHNFPMIEQRGDVFKADFTEFEGFDFVVGGSPCTYWSIAQKRSVRETEAHGIGWELFQQYVRAIRETKPKYFIYENNKSMSDAIRKEISEAFGFDAICINSALVSAQNRQRLYWVGVRNSDGTYRKADVEQPDDRGILLKDIIENGSMTDKDKSHAIIGSIGRTTHREYFQKSQGQMVAEPVAIAYRTRDNDDGSKSKRYEANGSKSNCLTTVRGDSMIAEPIRIGSLPRPNGELSTSQAMRIYNVDGKGVGLKANGGGMGAKTGLYAVPICHVIPQPVTVRKYTCDIEKLKALLRDHKKLTNKEIALATGKPQTLVEHWFRKDDCFAVPDADIWFNLKKLLGIETTEFDDFVTVFETRDGVFEKADRCYDPEGKMSTLMTCSNDKVIIQTVPCESLAEEYYKGGFDGNLIGMIENNGTYRNGKQPSQQYRVYSSDGKSVCVDSSPQKHYIVPSENDKQEPIYEVKDGMISIKGKQYPIKLADGYYIIRKLTVTECKRLQTVPDNYDMTVISDTQAYKCLGNGWTVDVIVHLIESALGTLDHVA